MKPWIVGPIALAVLLAGASLLGWLLSPHGFAVLLFTAVLPGAAVSFVTNALVMARHGDAGLARHEKIALGLQVGLLALLVAVVLGADGGTGAGALFGFGALTPLYIVLAAIVLGMAIARNRNLHDPQVGEDERFEDAASGD